MFSDRDRWREDPGQDLRFARAVASFGFRLRDPDFRERMSIAEILELAESGKGQDAFGYRAEFLRLVRAAEAL